MDQDFKTSLSCRELSPERGQVLSALVSQKVDIQVLGRAGADFSGAELIKADLAGANIGRVSLRNSRMIGVNLSEATLDNVDFSGSEISGSSFEGVRAKNALLVDLFINDLIGSKTKLGALTVEGLYESLNGSIITISPSLKMIDELCGIIGLKDAQARWSPPDRLDNSVFLVERLFGASKGFSLRGMIVSIVGIPPGETTLHKASARDGTVTAVSAIPVKTCYESKFR